MDEIMPEPEMRTECLPADREGVIKAAALLKSGSLAVFPTETVYGLGASALDAKAVSGIFKAKGRPADNPLIVHVKNAEDAAKCGKWNALAEKLARVFWPGPLTLIVGRRDAIPPEVSAGLDTVALRAPAHPAAQALLQACGLPVAAPSANQSGKPSPTTARHALDDLNGRVPLVLDGGPCMVGLESTVADARGEFPLILRPGAVTPEMLAMTAGECGVAESAMRAIRADEDAPSPGMRHTHYAPRAKMTLVQGSPEAVRAAIRREALGRKSVWVLVPEDHLKGYDSLEVRSLGGNARETARRLFDLLRQADREGVAHIYCETLPQDGLGLAVMNRLARAAGFGYLDAAETGDQEEH